MLHKKLDSVLGMLCGYFRIAILTLTIEVKTRSHYFKNEKKHQQQNGKLKQSSVII